MKRIPLTQGKSALVDDLDYPQLSQYRWCYTDAGAQCRIGKKMVLMHRFLLDPPAGVVVDHVNHDRLDNRRLNLRVVGRRENNWNRRKSPKAKSRYKGVAVKKGKVAIRYEARIHKDGERFLLGYFKTPEEAAKAYDAKARELFGEFAVCNFPTREESARQGRVSG